MGIAPAALSRVFQPFAQADAANGRNGKGLGLGLALAKALVELHGGTVAVASEGLGKGAEFSIRLPCARATAPRRPALPDGDRANCKRAALGCVDYQQSSEPV